MITDRIKALFNFIDFLHSNIENFTQYDEVVNELHLLAEQRSNYRAKSNFKEKLKYDEVQAKIAEKYDIIDKNIIQIIKAKVIELDICDWNETNTLWNNNIRDITELIENFSEDDIQIIISNKNKYIEYRTITKGEVYFGTGSFFSDLDQILKVLFDFFKESTINEFEAFETKTIQVDSIQEAVSLLNSRNKQSKTNKLTDTEKDQIFNEMVFDKGLYYFSDNFNYKNQIKIKYKDLENDFETKEDFIRAINSLLHANGLHFYSRLRTITNETEFIKHIQSQYNLYNEYTPNNGLKWLNFNKKAIMYGFGILRIDSDSLKATFMNWYNETVKSINPEAPQQTSELENYINSYFQTDFDEVMIDDKTINNVYLGNNFNEWLVNIDKNLNSNKSFDAETKKLLGSYNKDLCNLSNKIMTLYKEVSKTVQIGNSDLTAIYLRQNKVLADLKSIGNYSDNIKFLVLDKELIKANDIKTYCLLLLENCIYNLKDVLTIDVYSSPLKDYFINAETKLKNSIDFETLKLLKDLSIPIEAPEQPKANKLDEVLLKNEYVTIFKNDLGFTIFTKMFELYKTETTHLANFSFLFFAMEKEFLVCTQTDFVKFIENEKYNINIEKIDNRQYDWNKSKKSNLYNSIKETLQKKHEKSTI